MNPILERLTPRQREVFAARMKGHSNAQIGADLCIAPHTVKVLEMQIRERFDAEGTGWGWWIVAGRAYERGELADVVAAFVALLRAALEPEPDFRRLYEQAQRLQQTSVRA
jgi:hypothetical protein